MAFCPKCGAEVEEGATFCQACGNNLKGEATVAQPVVVEDEQDANNNKVWEYLLISVSFALSRCSHQKIPHLLNITLETVLSFLLSLLRLWLLIGLSA